MKYTLAKKLLKRILNRKKSPTPVDVLAGYAHWANTYPPTAHNPLMEIEQQAMLSLLPDDLSGNVCLDLACGSGRYMRLVAQRGATQIFGADFSPHMLAQAANYQLTMDNEQSSNPKSKISKISEWGQNPKLTRAPFFPLPFPGNTFHLITCGLAVGHEKNLGRLLAEAARVLRPGGSIIYSDFHPFGALLGWQRTFATGNGAIFNVEHHRHLYSHHHRACQKAGLTIEAVLEPEVGQRASPEIQHVPAVLALRAVKTGRG